MFEMHLGLSDSACRTLSQINCVPYCFYDVQNLKIVDDELLSHIVSSQIMLLRTLTPSFSTLVLSPLWLLLRSLWLHDDVWAAG